MALPSSGPLSMNDIAGEFGGSTPHALNEYYAGGGLVPAGTSGTYGAVPSSGTISIQNFYGTSNFVPVYVEDVFSTWLYTGTGSNQTITNGINLSTDGGLVWIKQRDGTGFNTLFDTARGATVRLFSDNPSGNSINTDSLTAFNTTGFSLGTNSGVNASASTFVSWTFRKQPKFFDVVTYTGDGTAGRAISHNLGSVPGCVIVKRTDSSADWVVWHRSLSNPSKFLILNSAAAEGTDVNGPWGPFSSGYTTNASAFTSTVFRVANDIRSNASGATYVAYIFAHDAGGFGLTGTDSVISCGSFTGSSSTVSITLGWEPQWLLVKCSGSSGGNWILMDNIRGLGVNGGPYVYPNQSVAEYGQFTPSWSINATGFTVAPSVDINRPGEQSIYIAIRRGPMKTPTTGTSVFSPSTWTSVGGSTITTNFPVDMQISRRAPEVENFRLQTRKTGKFNTTPTNLVTQDWIATNGQAGFNQASKINYNWNNTGFFVGDDLQGATAGYGWAISFRRAPSFFDVACYTGTGTPAQYIDHNLGVAPELILLAPTNAYDDWMGYHASLTSISALSYTFGTTFTSGSGSGATSTIWQPSATSFKADYNALNANVNGRSYAAYLFATCPGVSKVGTYTGTGALQTIDCGFTSGARFVLIKQVSTTQGGWYIYDSARGISSGNDPYQLLNTNAAQVTGTNFLDTTSVGFQVTAAASVFGSINMSGVNYLFLAIA